MNSSPAKLLIATGNPGKVAEYKQLLGGLPCEFASLRDVGVDFEVEETGETFEDTPRLKAEAYAQASGLMTLADDSGIEVDVLGGAPGVRSARYGGSGLDDPGRVQLLLRELQRVPDKGRTGRFVCVIAIARPGTETRVVRGTVEGRIAHAPRGTGGFGYDPIFLLPDRGLTTAELQPDEKNAISHRGAAARLARPILLQLLRASSPSS